MNRLYILMILVVISLSGCNSYRNRSVSANKGSASIEQSDSSSVGNGETHKDTSEAKHKTNTDVKSGNEQTGFVVSKIYEYLFYLSAFINVCLIIIVYKKSNYISELEDDDIKNDKWRGYGEINSKKWEKNNFHAKSSTPKFETESSMNNRTEQETITDEKDEKPIIINLPLKNKYKYLIPAYQGKFPKMFDETSVNTFFRCWDEKGILYFEFDGNLNAAIESYNATFDETCIVEGSYKGATQYKVEAPGTLDKDLKILTKSVIRLY